LEETMTNKVIDRYSIELEMPADLAQPSLPVHCIATNTEDGSTTEVWLTLESTRALLNFAYGHEKDIVDSWFQQLQDHHYADLIAQQGATEPIRCIFNSSEILPFGFKQEELRPWRDEIEA
jgi:hypothetical protein